MNQSALSKPYEISQLQKLETVENSRQMPQSQLWFVNNRNSQPTTANDRSEKRKQLNNLNGSILPSVKHAGKTT